jgi:uncharacterized membrane protein YphA (DoxX/SURF4 family)
MNIVLWILQVLLAAQFAMHGWLFLSPPAELADAIYSSYAPWFRIFLGVAEVLAAVGLILPSATRILPWLTPLAAAGVMIVSASASVYHLTRGEFSNAAMTAVLLILATFVAYMRWKVRPIAPRGVADASDEVVRADELPSRS